MCEVRGNALAPPHSHLVQKTVSHVDKRDPKNWKGFRFAVPFELLHQTLQVRYHLAKAGPRVQ